MNFVHQLGFNRKITFLKIVALEFTFFIIIFFIKVRLWLCFCGRLLASWSPLEIVAE